MTDTDVLVQILALLPLQRPLIIFDTETTGPNPRMDRICEIGFIELHPEGSVREWQSFIHPTMPIPREATYGNGDNYPGHGITDEMVAEAPRFAELADSFLRGFSGCDFGGYNLKTFDLPLVQEEFQRAGITWSYAEARVLDGFRLWQIGRKRTLSDASEEFLGEAHDGAHRALDDVRTSLRVIVAQLLKFTQLPRDLAALHELQWPVDPNALDPDGKIVWKDGVATVNFGKKWRGKRLDLMARRDLEWIVNEATGMSPQVKQICRDALAGKFPTKE
jgi:DNA polymerase-3 subunit epsilon